jgi:KDO2-lipid IV(A) lauroyltransferase
VQGTDGATAANQSASRRIRSATGVGDARTRVGEAKPAPSRAWADLSLPQRCLFYLMVAVLHLLSLLPDLVLGWLGMAGALLTYHLDRRHVAIGLKNLEIAFPQASLRERRRILRQSYLNLGRGIAEFIRLGGFFSRSVATRVGSEHMERWEETLRGSQGRGVIILSAHFGSFELLAAVHAMRGYAINLVHHTQSLAAGDALLTFVRERAGIRIIRKHAAARAALRALKHGEMVGVPFDQNAKRSEAVFVPFFSELAATSAGLARLAKMANAPVVPAFIVRNGDKRSHRVIVGPPIPLVESDDLQADLTENTRRFQAEIERVVKQYPEQFLWVHRRYRTRPPGAPRIYQESGKRARTALRE